MNYSKLIRKAPHVYVIGNGGSYANAVHICNDLLNAGIRAYTMDPATLTAFANDYGYDQAFKRWIMTVGRRDDLLIALSGSGRSKNICAAVRKAKIRYMTVIGITGAYESNPPLANICHHIIRRGRTMQEAEEYQVLFGHQMMRALHKNV